MAILALDTKRAMEAQLGTFGTQRYTDQQHYLPAIRAAQRRLNGLVEGVFAENKGGEEIFMEITETRVFQTDAQGAVRFLEAELGHKMWSIVAFYPSPLTTPPPATIPVVPGQYLRPDLTFNGAGPKHTRRITMEQIGVTTTNRFMPGNEVVAGGPRESWAYSLTNDKASLIPLSQAANRVVAASYLRTIELIQSMNDSMPYPDRAFQLLRDLALNEIAGRQQPNLYERSINDVRTMLVSQA